MKKAPLFLLFVFALFACHAFAQAATATVTASFSVAGNPATAEYFVEQKQGANFVEVAKGTAAPLVFTVQNVNVGATLTFRIRARLPGNAASASAPSNEATAVVPLNTPSNFSIILAFPPTS